MFKILHYREKCLGCAYCVEAAPSLFRVNVSDGKIDLIGSQEKKDIQSESVNEALLEEA